MRSVEDLLPVRSSVRLRIYAWSPKNPAPEYQGLIKVGQTTREDVRERIRESQGQVQQEFTLYADEIAQRDDGSLFRDKDVIERLKAKGFENPRLFRVDLGRRPRRCAALLVEREDAFWQDLHLLPARQAHGSSARPRGDVQAGRAGRMA